MKTRRDIETVLTGWLNKVAGDWADEAIKTIASRAFVYAFPKADNTTDAVVFGLDLEGRRLLVRLIKRGTPTEPYFDHWALPGGFLNMDEPLEECARRELREETGIELAYMEQLYTFGKPDRDPRGRVIAVAYWGIVRPDQVEEIGGLDDASDSRWFDVADLPTLAFDHGDIIAHALQRLRGKLRWQPVGIWLLPEEFTLAELRGVYEIILGRPVDPGSFRRKIKPHQARGVLVDLQRARKASVGRPAALYRFDEAAYNQLTQDGLEFEV